MNTNDTMTINGEEWVRKASIPTAQETARNPDGLPFVICRGYYCGVHAGYLKNQNGNHCTLVCSRRLWTWKAKEGVSLSAVALNGISPDVVLPKELPEIWLGDVYEVIPCTPLAESSILQAPVRKQD